MTGQTRLKRTLELGSSLAVGIISSIIGACCSASSQSERGSRVPASRCALSDTWPDHDQQFVRRSLRMNTSRLPSPSLSRTLLGFGSCMRHATAVLDLDSGMSGETFLNCAPRTSCSPPKTARSSGRWSERLYHAGILWLPVGWEVGELEAAVSVFVYRRPTGTWNRPDCPCS